MKILNKILEVSLNTMNKKFNVDISKDSTRSKYEINIGKIDKKSKQDIDNEKSEVELEDISILKNGINLILGRKKENNKLVYSFMTKTNSNNNKHIQRISFYLYPMLDSIKKNGKISKRSILIDNDSTVYCDCKSFKYHFSKINKKRKTYYLGSKNRNNNNYTVKGLKPSPNPRNLGGLCKHLKYDIDYINNNITKISKDIYSYLDNNTNFIKKYK